MPDKITVLDPILFTQPIEQVFNTLSSASHDTFLALWDLDAGVAPLLAQMPLEVRKQLGFREEAIWKPDELAYVLFYVPQTLFSVTHNGTRRQIFNLGQYFAKYENPGLEVAQLCANELMTALHTMKLYPNTLASPIRIFETCCMKGWDLPTAYDMPDWVQKKADVIAWTQAAHKWQENYQIGHWDKVWAYDQRSAYGQSMIHLLDLRYGEWRISNQYEPAATYGWADCMVSINENVLVHPIIRCDADGSNQRMDVGIYPAQLNKRKMDYITRYKLGEFEVIGDAYWWKCQTKVEPLEHVIQRLLNYKEHKNPIVQSQSKSMAAELWGKMMEKKGGHFTENFNPYWADEANSEVHIKNCDLIYKYKVWDNLIAVISDEVVLDKPLPEVPQGWKLAYEGECVMLDAMKRLYWLGDRHPPLVSLEDLKNKGAEHPHVGFYAKSEKSTITLGEALEAGEVKDVGKTKEKTTEIDLYRLKPRRVYDKLPQNGEQLLNNVYRSRPRKVMEV